MSRIRVLLADDHAVSRAGMKLLLSEAGFDVVAEATNGNEALDRALALNPDVAVLDYNMPGLTGAEVTGRLRDRAPDVKVVVLSAHEDRAFVRQALGAGAKAYVLKRAAAETLVLATETVASGGTYLDPALTPQLIAQFADPSSESGGNGHGLSPREEEVLRLLALGYANKQAAARLKVSVKTIETYKIRAMEKLDLKDRVDLVRYASGHGWLTQSEPSPASSTVSSEEAARV